MALANRDVKTGESIPLVVRPPHFLRSREGLLLVGSTLAAGGSLIIFLHVAPGQTCATLPECGKWLTDRLGQWLSPVIAAGVAPLVFTVCAGGEVAVYNAVMAIKSAPGLIHLVVDQKSQTINKKAVLGVTIFAASQAVEKLYVAVATNASFRNMVFATLGAMPAAMFTFVKLKTVEIPRLVSRWSHSEARFLLKFATDKELADKPRFDHYKKQQEIFLNVLEKTWGHLMAYSHGKERQENEKPHQFLARYALINDASDSSWRDSVWRHLSSAVGLLGGGYITGVLEENARREMSLAVGDTAAIFITPMLCIAVAYSVTHLMTEAAQASAHILKSCLAREPIPSLSFQLQPAATAAAWGLSMTAAGLSYATFLLVVRKNYQDKEWYGETVRDGSIIDINIAHYAGMMHLNRILFSRSTKSEMNRFLFEVEEWVQDAGRFPLETFIDFVERFLTQTERNRFGIKLYSPSSAASQAVQNNQGSMAEEKKQVALKVATPVPPQSRHATSWCSWFTSCVAARKKPEVTRKSTYGSMNL